MATPMELFKGLKDKTKRVVNTVKNNIADMDKKDDEAQENAAINAAMKKTNTKPFEQPVKKGK